MRDVRGLCNSLRSALSWVRTSSGDRPTRGRSRPVACRRCASAFEHELDERAGVDEHRLKRGVLSGTLGHAKGCRRQSPQLARCPGHLVDLVADGAYARAQISIRHRPASVRQGTPVGTGRASGPAPHRREAGIIRRHASVGRMGGLWDGRPVTTMAGRVDRASVREGRRRARTPGPWWGGSTAASGRSCPAPSTPPTGCCTPSPSRECSGATMGANPGPQPRSASSSTSRGQRPTPPRWWPCHRTTASMAPCLPERTAYCSSPAITGARGPRSRAGRSPSRRGSWPWPCHPTTNRMGRYW
jgi:hypothetical protein